MTAATQTRPKPWQFLVLLSLIMTNAARAQELIEEPDFYFFGDTRIGHEHLDGQFRAGLSGSDSASTMRTLVASGWQSEKVGLHFELQDARAYGNDAGTPTSTSLINALEPLQFYTSIDINPLDQLLHSSRLKLGRFTMDIGSRRFVERNNYRNTINAYSGAHWTGEFLNGLRLDGFYVNPVRRYPRDREGMERNEFVLDKPYQAREFWGIHLQNFQLPLDILGELFIYGLSEKDTPEFATQDREVYAPGFRLRRPADEDRIDFELETAFRSGEISTSTTPGSPIVDVHARMVHAEIGYTMDSPWSHRLSLEWDLATGDDTDTTTYERYDRFYGTRRGDLGNTRIHGPLTRSNASIAGIRYQFSNGVTDGRMVFQHALLDSATDAWIVAGRRDPSGASGREIGQTFDFRVRHWIIRDRIRGDVGGSVLWLGDFPKTLADGPEDSRTEYVYSQISFYF